MTIERFMAAGTWKANEQATFRQAQGHMVIGPQRLRLREDARGEVRRMVMLQGETHNEKASSLSEPHIPQLTFLDDTHGYIKAAASSPLLPPLPPLSPPLHDACNER